MNGYLTDIVHLGNVIILSMVDGTTLLSGYENNTTGQNTICDTG